MVDCLFCSIASGQEKRASIVYQDELVLVIMSPRQANPGHVLITPAAHIERLQELPEETGMHMFKIAMRMQRAIEKAGIKCEGTYLGLAAGSGSFQMIPHIYMDLIPRFSWDDYYTRALIDEPYADPDALLRWLAEERTRLWTRRRPRALADETSAEVLDELAGRIRESYAAIWGSST